MHGREVIYGGPDKGRRVGSYILPIMLGQGDRVDVKVPGRRDPTSAGFGLFYSVPGLCFILSPGKELLLQQSHSPGQGLSRKENPPHH